jgi:hypothetical protein
MDDPRLAAGVTIRADRARHIVAVGVCFAFAIVAASSGARGQQPAPGMTPPISEPWTRGPVLVDSAQSYRAPGVATYPEATWFGGAAPLVLADRGYLAPVPLPSTEGPLYRLASLQEPSDAPPVPPDPNDPSYQDPSYQNDPNAPPPNQDGTPQRYGKEPENNTLQFLRNQDVLLDKGSWQFDTGIAYTFFDSPFPSTTTNVSGNVTAVDQGHVRRTLLYTPLGVRYGLTKNVQFFGYLPVGYSSTQTSTFGTSEMANSGGQGDLTAGLNFHILKAYEDHPDVIATFGFTAPTGNYTTPLFALVPGSALGQGFWALQTQLTAIHRYDPVIVFYGAGYRHLFARSFDGTPYVAGEQLNYQFGTGFSINDRVTFSTTLQGFYFTNTKIDGTTVRGSNVEPISLRFAATIARRCKILEPWVAVGMTQYAANASTGFTITYY